MGPIKHGYYCTGPQFPCGFLYQGNPNGRIGSYPPILLHHWIHSLSHVQMVAAWLRDSVPLMVESGQFRVTTNSGHKGSLKTLILSLICFLKDILSLHQPFNLPSF